VKLSASSEGTRVRRSWLLPPLQKLNFMRASFVAAVAAIAGPAGCGGHSRATMKHDELQTLRGADSSQRLRDGHRGWWLAP
jgi:hypothetical protein